MLYALIRFVMDGVAELMSRLFGCVACAAVLLASSPALASVALSCSIADKMLDLTLEGTISRGVGEGLISVKGEAKANIEMLSGEARAFTFERGEITQYWLGGQNLKLRLYRETAVEPHETLDIVIDVRSKGDLMPSTTRVHIQRLPAAWRAWRRGKQKPSLSRDVLPVRWNDRSRG